ncbi:MAG: aminotransferase class I/II-fold pyridoxal phosphate-dependent enzyme [Ruminococcaceae bacterium]|nr:aminotransferase class I/II-fold pyridoxal phosphate-dependent enzyme [Oscillospiraceae bacterium]
MIDYSKILSERACSLKPSGIRKFFDILDEMKDVVSLTVGQPDFVTPWHIREAAIESLEKGRTYYTSNAGLTPLREEIVAYMQRRFDLKYNAKEEVLVTVGGSEAIDLAIRATVNPGDEVIIPQPSFVCYEPITVMAGGTPVIIPLKAENNFKLTADELRAAITPRTKMLVLPFPNNPTGAIMNADDLKEIADVLRDTNILVLSDEIYAELTYTGKHISIASLDGMRERTIIASGFSKAYAMTGWRLGYTLAPKEITAQMFKVHQYGIMCAPTVSQFAAIEALRAGDSDIEYMKDEYNRRRLYITSGFASAGIECFKPEGAFYVFANVGGFGMTSEEFCTKLLYEAGVAIVPGNAFGECGEGFARVSYAYSVNHISTAIEKIDQFVKKLKNN